MKRRFLIAAILALSAVVASQTDPSGAIQLKSSVPIPGVKGAFDHFAADVKGNRLFLAAEDNKTVEIFDLKTGRHLYSVPGFDAPHAIVYVPENNTLLVTDSGPEDGPEGYIRVVSLATNKVADSIKLLSAADSAGYDPDTHLIYADTGGLEAKMNYTVIAVIDVRQAKKANEIKVDSGRVEAIQFERNGSKMFANLRTKGQVGVFDKRDYKLTATWPIPDAAENVPMALDEGNHRLFVVTRKPGKLFVFDTESGKVVASLPSVSRADDMAYDAQRKRIYVSGGDGFVTVYSQKDRDHYEQIGHVPSGPGGKISIFVPELNRLYVAASAEGANPAKILIYEVK